MNFRYNADSYEEALVKAERALEIEKKELGAKDEWMAELYRLLAAIWGQVNVMKNWTTRWYIIKCIKCKTKWYTRILFTKSNWVLQLRYSIFIFQKFSAIDNVPKENLWILHKVISNSEKGITIYRRLPQNQKYMVQSFAIDLSDYKGRSISTFWL